MRTLGFFLIFATACSSTTTITTVVDSGGADASPMDDGGSAEADAPSNMCSAAIASVLKPVNMVSTGVVSVVSQSGSTSILYIDATAGGFGNSDTFPRVYVNLETDTRVNITDVQAATSTAWDLAFKRPVIFTNGGNGGPGMGGTLVLSKAFDQVTAADATGTFAVPAATVAVIGTATTGGSTIDADEAAAASADES